jgi:hypothetical protein
MSVEVKVFHAMEAYSGFSITEITYNIKRQLKK